MAPDATPTGSAEAGATVFVSYAHEDRDTAEAIVACLETAGYRAWWDGLIPAGAVFASTTERALESARVVVVLWSRASLQSHWVRDEATHGRDRNRLVPVSLDGVEPPIGFRQHLFINLAGWDRRSVTAPVRALLASVSALHGEPVAPPAVAAGAPLSRRSLLAAGCSLAVAAAGAGAYLWHRTAAERERLAANAIAVLPFTNLSGDPAQAYFSDGISAEVRAALVRVRNLRVIAQVSSEAFRDGHSNAVTIANSLGVSSLLEGSVRRAGSRFRIATELVDGRTGFSLWSQTFDRPVDDVFAVQREIASSVLAALGDALRGGTAGAPTSAPGGTSVVGAYEAFLRGRALSNADDDDRAALLAYEAALAADPAFALAHAARAQCLVAISNRYGGVDRRQTIAEAERAARRAIELAPDCAPAHLALGFVRSVGLDLRGAREPYESAYQLGGGDGHVLAVYSVFAAETGRAAEAATAMSRALERDPLNPVVQADAGYVHAMARHYADALVAHQRALELNPKYAGEHWESARALLALGRTGEAREACLREALPLARFTGLAVVERRVGNAAAADTAFATLKQEAGDDSLYQQAEVLAQWGRPDEAMVALHRARNLFDGGLTSLAYDELLDPLRGRADFQALARDLGFDVHA